MAKSRVTNKDVLGEIEKIQTKLELVGLENEPEKELKEKVNENSVKFLLAEYQHIRDIWKQTDARTESALRLYFTVTTIFISSIAILYKQGIEFEFILQFGIILLAGLILGSIFILRRITSTIYLKIEYFQSMNLIRQYFKDQDFQLENYLLLPSINKENISQEGIGMNYKKKLNAPIITAFIFWISILAGILGVLISYVFTKESPSQIFIILSSGIVAFILFLIFLLIQNKNIMQNQMNNVLSRIPSK